METFYKLIFLLYCLSFVVSQSCPPKCQCIHNAVRCLHQGLTKIPKTSVEAETLDFRFNKIHEIPPGEFSHLHRLRSLLLNDNQIQALRSRVFYGLRRLKYLYLYRNRIQFIDHDVFHGLQHLEQLYLHANEIHHIDAHTFSNLPRLERLYLHNNWLKHIPPNSFSNMPKLRKLRLDNNALICDCSLLWLVRMMAGHGHMKIAATCHAPDTLVGIPLGSMRENNLHCREPEIQTEPQDAVISFGENAIFTCVAIGEPSPKIVWLRNSETLPYDGAHYEVMDNGTLMIHNANESDAGFFECMAKNPAGEVKSRPARMILQPSIEPEVPVISRFSPSKKVRVNEDYVSFDCEARGMPKPHLVWLFNGNRLLLEDRIKLLHNGTIVLHHPIESDSGHYTCQAENIKGHVSATAELVILVPPTFNTVPTDKTLAVGSEAEFKCQVKGVPKPTITWFRNNAPVFINDNIRLDSDNEKIVIAQVNVEDEGTYNCRAENSEGSIESSAVLRVVEPNIVEPKILVKPENTDAYKGTSVQLPCEVEDEESSEIEWRKDGSAVKINDRVFISEIGSLIINNITSSDMGRYECLVYNDYGRDTASAFLTVKSHILPNDEYVNLALIEATRDIDRAISRTMNQLFNKTSEKEISILFKVARYPNAPAREVARSAEIYERTLDKVKEYLHSGGNITSAEPFKYQDALTPNLLDVIARLSGCVAHTKEKNCSEMCYHSKYRTIDGTCNNFAHPIWGSSLSGFRRIINPIYENGFSQPIGWDKDKKYNGYKLPSARLVSTELISTSDITEDIEITHMAMQWGQWLDHDLDHALPPVSSQSWDGVDCKKTCNYAPPCFPIDVPHNDSRVSNRRCIDFIRTSAVCGSGETSIFFGTLQVREQINQLTSFIDASQVYGFEKSVSEDLRDLSNDNGFLRVGATFEGKKPLLPTVGLNGMDCRRNLEESNRNCFVAGDIRANEQIGLAAMHTIWMREHNRIALQLKSFNPFWDGEKIYQEARKIVGAEMQVITFESWLPVVLGPKVHQHLGKYSGYNSNLNPSISNVFATAALRFGHTMINPLLHRYDENFEPISQGHLPLRHAFFSPWRLVDEGGVDPLFRGMFMTPAKLKTPTQNLNSELTEHLFYSAHAVALDLAAINIQRGRDHGIPPYTTWRKVCNLTKVEDFDDLTNEISNSDVREKLRKLYGSVHNIDVWVGGILEDPVEGGKVGPLFRCLLLEQFKRLRDGDRFWYENPSVFKPEQLEQIRKTNLARILCDNGDNIDTISENVFYLPESQDGLVSCEDLPVVDLRFWAECDTCSDDIADEQAAVRRRRDVKLSSTIEEDFNFLKASHNQLEETVKILIERIDYLEKNQNATAIRKNARKEDALY